MQAMHDDHGAEDDTDSLQIGHLGAGTVGSDRRGPRGAGQLARQTRWILGAWAGLSAFSALGTALTPKLLAFPMLLVAFTPRLPFLILAATVGQPGALLRRRRPGMLVGDPIDIALGRRYGGRFVPDRPRRIMNRLGLLGVALRPTSKVLAAAGACKLRTSRVLTADILGTLGLLASIYVGTTSVVG